YEIAPAQAVGKLHAAYKAAAYKPVRFQGGLGARNYRFQVEKLDPDLMDFKHNSGFFFEYDANELNEILPVCNEKCQTLTYLGMNRDDLSDFLRTAAPKGIDRVVPVGKSMDFGLVWDGYDLIRTLSRRYVIE
ncbi:MAG: acyl-CoA reductase, partial [Clostridiales bacterium]|nr:acyl-CoA reductase [Clostridiales bacterium]